MVARLKLQQGRLALRVIQGRWKLLILRELIEAVRRFSDPQRCLSGVSQKVLTAQLRELEGDGVVERTARLPGGAAPGGIRPHQPRS